MDKVKEGLVAFMGKAQEISGDRQSSYALKEGKKFYKVVETISNGQVMVHSFVDKITGDIFKPATWAAPAKHARGNVLSEDFGATALTPWGIKYLK